MYDERAGTHCSKLLFEKGFDNVYLLTGGIESFHGTHSTLIEGTDIPPVPVAKDAKKKMGATKTSGFTKSMSSTQTTKFGKWI